MTQLTVKKGIMSIFKIGFVRLITVENLGTVTFALKNAVS
jgi:hypothetical protein